MVGTQGTVKGAQPVEYVEESTFNTLPTDPDMKWFGMVDSLSVTQGVEQETVRSLPPTGENAKLEYLQNVKISEMYEVEVTYNPQNRGPPFPVTDYVMGASGSLSDSLTSISIGLQDENNGEYNYLSGCVAEEFTLTIEEDSTAEISMSFIGADQNDWTATDYVASGSHATESTEAPLTYDDLGSINLGGSPLGDAIESLTLTVSNNLEVVKDPDSAAGSHIEAIAPVSREITTELALTYDDMSQASSVRNYNSQNLTFDFPDSGSNSRSWTVSGTRFPEFPHEFTAESLIGDTLTSDPCPDLTYS